MRNQIIRIVVFFFVSYLNIPPILLAQNVSGLITNNTWYSPGKLFNLNDTIFLLKNREQLANGCNDDYSRIEPYSKDISSISYFMSQCGIVNPAKLKYHLKVKQKGKVTLMFRIGKVKRTYLAHYHKTDVITLTRIH